MSCNSWHRKCALNEKPNFFHIIAAARQIKAFAVAKITELVEVKKMGRNCNGFIKQALGGAGNIGFVER
jgi:hypothetical protein